MHRLRTTSIAVVAAIAVAGCGSSGSSTVAQQLKANQQQSAKHQRALAASQKKVELATTRAQLDQNMSSVLAFCLASAKQKAGEGSGPTSEERRAEHIAVYDAQFTVKDSPNVTINGQSLKSFYFKMATYLELASCDTPGAASVTHQADKLP